MHYEQGLKGPRAVPKFTSDIDISIIKVTLDYHFDCSQFESFMSIIHMNNYSYSDVKTHR